MMLVILYMQEFAGLTADDLLCLPPLEHVKSSPFGSSIDTLPAETLGENNAKKPMLKIM